MRTIQYRVQYTGATGAARSTMRTGSSSAPAEEIVEVQAININSGYAKALKRALEPLGSGVVREIGSVEFWQVVS